MESFHFVLCKRAESRVTNLKDLAWSNLHKLMAIQLGLEYTTLQKISNTEASSRLSASMNARLGGGLSGRRL